MSTQKNQQRLLSIFREILRIEPQAALLMVGNSDTPVGNKLKRTMLSSDVKTHILMPGVRLDVPRLIKASDLMIFPSLWEGLPGVVLESCAVGTPVLASDLPGTAEIARHFSLVRMLSLDAADCVWANQAVTLAHNRCRRHDASSFGGRPFDLQTAIVKITNVWDSAAARAD